jgi:hypothetical protein
MLSSFMTPPITNPSTKRDYVLINSDNRTLNSVSTTDFTIRMPVPLNDVIKTDLVAVSMDYHAANIAAPNNSFTIGLGLETGETRLLRIEDGVYTPYTLMEEIQFLLGTDYTVFLVAGKLVIEYNCPSAESDLSIWRSFNPMSESLLYRLGLVEALTPSFLPEQGRFGAYRWAFPNRVSLPGNHPYLLIQSRALGTDIKTANNTIGFWRMLLHDAGANSISMLNNRVDTYLAAPRTLQDIDVKLLYPDGSQVNNNGGRFTFLLEIVRSV